MEEWCAGRCGAAARTIDAFSVNAISMVRTVLTTNCMNTIGEGLPLNSLQTRLTGKAHKDGAALAAKGNNIKGLG